MFPTHTHTRAHALSPDTEDTHIQTHSETDTLACTHPLVFKATNIKCRWGRGSSCCHCMVT